MAAAVAASQADEWSFVHADDDGAVFISESPNDLPDVSASIMRSTVLSPERPSSAATTPAASPSKGEPVLLKAHTVFACVKCKTHLASPGDLESKAFRGRHGAAYLFGSVVNTALGPVEERKLLTGLHTVRDVSCAHCSQLLGWKYETAVEVAQKWKEGKIILEKAVIEKADNSAYAAQEV